MKLKNFDFSDTTVVFSSSGKMIINYDDLEEDYYYKNWTYDCKYNIKSQLIYYSYSGCDYCSTTVYDIYVLYDNSGKIKQLENIRRFKYEFHYDDKNNIIEVNTYKLNLNQSIKLKKRNDS